MNEHQPARMNLHRLSRAQARYESGMEHVRRGRHESAASSFTGAIRLDRDNAEYRYLRGLVYFHLERYDKAISDFRTPLLVPPLTRRHTLAWEARTQWPLSTNSPSSAMRRPSGSIPDTRKLTPV